MKLRQIKLAGFKTFVDQTTIKLDGQLAGIVGPNGCGKSNIMESVKWVLGSSSAKEMRGDSMESVIFNGTDDRQPIGRASVELFFDNSKGTAPAEWASYAEISVKRIIEKDKGSTYLINNTTVRRKDVADLFLGTGLGAKGYAIIGQNTVSQIVEAKPEELKNYLEEAAGVSKYKERRKETEYRLRDTKENLERVNDLLREINTQITKLESQAQTAKKHNELQDKVKLIQAQIYFVKKRLAGTSWEESKEKVKDLMTKLDKFKAELTNIETQTEAARQEHIKASDSININQTKFYETNSLVSDVENKLNNLNEKITRLAALKETSKSKLQDYETQQAQLNIQLNESTTELHESKSKQSKLIESLADLKENFIATETDYLKSVDEWTVSNRKLQELNEQLNIENATLSLSTEIIKDLNERTQILQAEVLQLKENKIDTNKPKELVEAEQKLNNIEVEVVEGKKILIQINAEIDSIKNAILNNKQHISDAEIHISSLKQLSESEINPEQISSWLNSIGLKAKENIFKSISINEGWESSIGNILGSRMHAYQSINIDTAYKNRPPRPITLVKSNDFKPLTRNKDLRLALDVIEIEDESLSGVMAEWLSNVYISESTNIVFEQQKLEPGEILITKEGDLYGANYQIVGGHSNNQENHLQVMKKIEGFEGKLPSLLDEKDQLAKKIEEVEISKENKEAELQAREGEYKNFQQEVNTTLQEFNKKISIVEFNKNRLQTIEKEKLNLSIQLKENTEKLDAKKIIINDLINNIQTQSNHVENYQKVMHKNKEFFDNKKIAFDDQEKLAQEISYTIKVLDNKILNINERKNNIEKEKSSLLNQLTESNEEHNQQDVSSLQEELKEKLLTKETAEKELIHAREDLSNKENTLRDLESKRLEYQHAINPVSEELQQARLNEREASVIFESCCESLKSSKLSENEISETLDPNVDLTFLDEQYNKTNNRIERLGPVNLAAITELESIKERQIYIQKQVEDLQDASDTLQNAIQKIDKETREKLKNTFNEVNINFNNFFKTLFNGGRAQLDLLGNEILDTGLQVVAQPPGKKNQTIHLLSGGEKALTAIALVFALFKLNPSPFCLMDEVDAPLDDSNAKRFCDVVKSMSGDTQFLFVSHNKITMEIAEQLIGVTMQEPGVSRIVEVDLQEIHSANLVE